MGRKGTSATLEKSMLEPRPPAQTASGAGREARRALTRVGTPPRCAAAERLEACELLRIIENIS